jgi:hypothetical protein
MKESCLTANRNRAQWRASDTRDVSTRVVSVGGNSCHRGGRSHPGGKREFVREKRRRRQLLGWRTVSRCAIRWHGCKRQPPRRMSTVGLIRPGGAAGTAFFPGGIVRPTKGKNAYFGQGIGLKRRSWEARLTDRRRRLQSRTWKSLPSIVAGSTPCKKQRHERNARAAVLSGQTTPIATNVPPRPLPFAPYRLCVRILTAGGVIDCKASGEIANADFLAWAWFKLG